MVGEASRTLLELEVLDEIVDGHPRGANERAQRAGRYLAVERYRQAGPIAGFDEDDVAAMLAVPAPTAFSNARMVLSPDTAGRVAI